MEQRVTAWPWGQGLASQGQAVMPLSAELALQVYHLLLLGAPGGLWVAVVTGIPTPLYRSCTVVKSNHPSSRPWHNPMTPSTLTLSSHPVHLRVCPFSGLGWYRREAGSGGTLGRRGGQDSGRPRCVGRQAGGSLTFCPHLILPDSPTPGF